MTNHPCVSTNRLSTAIALLGLMGLAFLVSSCQHSNASLSPRTLTVKQNWELKPGHFIGGHLISGGLGDVSIEMKGKSVYAPFPGILQAHPIQANSTATDRSTASSASVSSADSISADSISADSIHSPSIQCAIFSSSELPAYVLRLCGLQRPKFGELEPGAVMGKGQTLQFAALRKQPSGEWAIVEPASDILERILSKP